MNCWRMWKGWTCQLQSCWTFMTQSSNWISKRSPSTESITEARSLKPGQQFTAIHTRQDVWTKEYTVWLPLSHYSFHTETVYVSVCMRVCMYACVCMHMCICLGMCACMHVCIHVCVHVWTRVFIYWLTGWLILCVLHIMHSNRIHLPVPSYLPSARATSPIKQNKRRNNQTNIYTYTHNIHTIHTHTHTYIHIHTQHTYHTHTQHTIYRINITTYIRS